MVPLVSIVNIQTDASNVGRVTTINASIYISSLLMYVVVTLPFNTVIADYNHWMIN